MTVSARCWWLALVVFAGVLLWLLSPVLMPFAVAGLLAYLGAPLVARLTRLRLPRSVAAALTLGLILLVLAAIPLFAFPLLERQLSLLLRKWPEYIVWVNEALLPWLRQQPGLAMLPDAAQARDILLEHWQTAGSVAAQVLGTVTRSWLTALAWLANLVLVPVIAFYLLRDGDRLGSRLRALLPRYAEDRVVAIARECDEVLAAFLRGQLWVMFALGVVYSAGLWLAGLELALLIGMFAGALAFVPYLGLIVGLAAAAVAALLQAGWEPALLIPVALVFLAGQLLESLVLTPWLVGDRIGLHPVAVLFAVLAGGQLFGALGVLLALPVGAVIAVMLRHAGEFYVGSELYDDRARRAAPEDG